MLLKYETILKKADAIGYIPRQNTRKTFDSRNQVFSLSPIRKTTSQFGLSKLVDPVAT